MISDSLFNFVHAWHAVEAHVGEITILTSDTDRGLVARGYSTTIESFCNDEAISTLISKLNHRMLGDSISE